MADTDCNIFAKISEKLTQKTEGPCIYIHDIINALALIDDSFYKLQSSSEDSQDNQTNGHPENIRKYLTRVYERMFAYELYHILRCIIDYRNSTGDDIYLGLTLSGEPKKFKSIYKYLIENYVTGSDNGDSNKKQEEKLTAKGNSFIPDLVLHDPLSIEQQIYYVEIKMDYEDPNIDFNKISKLRDDINCYNKGRKITEKVGDFKYYIFIYIGCDSRELKNKTQKGSVNENTKNIICICAKSRDNIKVGTLHDICSKQDQETPQSSNIISCSPNARQYSPNSCTFKENT